MDHKIYKKNVSSLINQLDIDDYQKGLIVADWLEFISHLEKLVEKNYIMDKVLTVVSIIGGASIPAVSAFPISETYSKIVFSILGVITASSVGISQSFKYNEKWRHFRNQVEKIRIEGERFFSLSGNLYSNKTHKECLPIFIERISIIKSEEIDKYTKIVDMSLLQEAGK